MPSKDPAFDWDQPCAHNARQKARFHSTARARLRRLADELQLEPGSYEIRANKGGIAVSGEVTLHHDRLYVQAAQSVTGPDGLLVRTCEGRRDFTGGRNNLLPLRLLDDPSALADRCRRIQPEVDRTQHHAPVP